MLTSNIKSTSSEKAEENFLEDDFIDKIEYFIPKNFSLVVFLCFFKNIFFLLVYFPSNRRQIVAKKFNFQYILFKHEIPVIYVVHSISFQPFFCTGI